MTSPRPRAGSESGNPGDLAWIVLVIIASVVGGLAAAAIDRGRVPLVIDLVISVIIGVATAFTALRRLMALAAAPVAAIADPRFNQGQPQHNPGRQAQHAGELHDPVLVLPIAGPAGPSSPWWELAGKPRPGGAGERDVLRPHELDRYQDAAFIAQCPNCGAFELDAKQGPDQWKFGCYACGCSWTWRPGTAWPPVQVRPKLRTKAGGRGGRPPSAGPAR